VWRGILLYILNEYKYISEIKVLHHIISWCSSDACDSNVEGDTVVARSDRVSAMVVQYSNLQYMTREPWVARGLRNVQSRPRKSRCVKFKVMMEGRKELANGLSEAASCQGRKEKGEKGEKGEARVTTFGPRWELVHEICHGCVPIKLRSSTGV
jgi:hypothetical protein